MRPSSGTRPPEVAAADTAEPLAPPLDSIARRLAATHARLMAVLGDTAVFHDAQRRLRAATQDIAALHRLRLLPDSAPGPRLDSLFERMRAAAGPLARDPQAKARFDSAMTALRGEMMRLHGEPTATLPLRPVLPPARPLLPGLPTDSLGFPRPPVLRGLVSGHFPRALAGDMGHKPFVWFVLDSGGRVTHTAHGPAGLAIAPTDRDWRRFDSERAERVTGDSAPAGRQLMLDPRAASLKFPDVSAAQHAGVTWTQVPAGRDTVQVILVSPATR